MTKPIATKVYCDGVCPAVIVWTACDGVEYSWHSVYGDKILGGCVSCDGVESWENAEVFYLRNTNGDWIADSSHQIVSADLAAHLDLVEEQAAAYRLNHFADLQ